MRFERDLQEFEYKLKELKKHAESIYSELEELSKDNEKRFELRDKEIRLSRIISDIIYYKERIEDIKDYQERQQVTPDNSPNMESKKENLLREKNKATEKIKTFEQALKAIKNQPYLSRVIDELEYSMTRYQNRVKNIEERLRIYENNPDLTDGEIDIYLKKSSNGIAFSGAIFLHNQDIEIGNVDYRGQTNSYTIGDIGYMIERDYRGHNYAYKALKLVQDIILSTGRESVIITTHANNTSSKKTIEKFGGVLIPGDNDEVLAYECHLVPKVELTDSTIKR